VAVRRREEHGGELLRSLAGLSDVRVRVVRGVAACDHYINA